MFYGHGNAMWEELLRVPLVVRTPQTKTTRRSHALVSHVDLVPTLLDLLGLPVELELAGRSFAPVLRGETDSIRDTALSSSVAYGPDQRAYRSGSLKLIEHPGGEHPPEVYDLAHDPGERKNQPERAAPLLTDLEARWSALVPVGDVQVFDVDEETRRRLEAIGYAQ